MNESTNSARYKLLSAILVLLVTSSLAAATSNWANCRGSVVKTEDATGTKWSLVCTAPCDESKGCEQWDSYLGKACRCPDAVQINCCDIVLDESAQGEAQIVADGLCETVVGSCPMGAGDCTWDKIIVYYPEKTVTYYVGLCKES